MIQVTHKYGSGAWVKDPIRSNWNLARAVKNVKELLKDGVPRWASHPREFKNWALECYLRDKEISDAQVAEYRLEDQDVFSNSKAIGLMMGSRAFIKKLRDNGVRCFTYQVPPGPETPPEMVNTVGLWAEIPSEKGIGHEYQGHRHQYICYMDIPSMYEWSLARLDKHNLAIGEKHRGWRTVLSQLILKKVLTETQAHKIFGEPCGQRSKIYRRTMHKFRNGRIKPNDRRLEAIA
jgi:hypothetical protein